MSDDDKLPSRDLGKSPVFELDYNFSPENTIIGWNFKKNPNSIITEKPS